MKRTTHFFIALLLLSQLVQGEQIYSFNSSINANEVYHVELTVLRGLELQVEGSTNGILSFLALDTSSYQLWSDFLKYTPIYQISLSEVFDFTFFAILEINSTLHLLFINNETSSVDLNLTIDEISTTSEEVPLSYFISLVSILFVSMIYKKTIRSS